MTNAKIEILLSNPSVFVVVCADDHARATIIGNEMDAHMLAAGRPQPLSFALPLSFAGVTEVSCIEDDLGRFIITPVQVTR